VTPWHVARDRHLAAARGEALDGGRLNQVQTAQARKFLIDAGQLGEGVP
jgi:hypothetical protein